MAQIPNAEITVRREGAITVLDLLGLILVGLKVAGQTEWSWVLVTLPFWMPWIYRWCDIFLKIYKEAEHGGEERSSDEDVRQVRN